MLEVPRRGVRLAARPWLRRGNELAMPRGERPAQARPRWLGGCGRLAAEKTYLLGRLAGDVVWRYLKLSAASSTVSLDQVAVSR